jgi:hypothetical protein
VAIVAALAIHADRDPVALQGAGEVVAGELAALVGVEDLGAAPYSCDRCRRRQPSLIQVLRHLEPRQPHSLMLFDQAMIIALKPR